MIPFRRLTLAPSTVTPPDRPALTVPAAYECAACECTGRGTHCWCCEKPMGEDA